MINNNLEKYEHSCLVNEIQLDVSDLSIIMASSIDGCVAFSYAMNSENV